MNPKQVAALKAVEYIQEDMIVGLGTGTTAFYAIERLGEMVKEGLRIRAVCSSLASTRQAISAGIPQAGMTEIKGIDIYIDGADEVDDQFNLVKGGGGALTREKILAFNSQLFIVIVDDSKLSPKLGRFPVAVEMVPFGYNLAIPHLEALGCKASIRQKEDNFYKTDNGNWIIDCQFQTIPDPGSLAKSIHDIPGVVECGLFPHDWVDVLISGSENGTARKLKQPS
ncbi:MAG TPA: ribose-5-phosphate isomerase RpiA [Flavisolibacter sp.]|nr:ribose-5-phosphate isomerase RpiA [Flavisolibacter sp.]